MSYGMTVNTYSSLFFFKKKKKLLVFAIYEWPVTYEGVEFITYIITGQLAQNKIKLLSA